MNHLSLDTLLAACSPGGSSVLTSVTPLAPAAGEHAAIAPARYVSGRNSTYAFETRYIDGEAATVTIVDGKASSINRLEEAFSLAFREGNELLARTPHIALQYPDRSWFDFELPHRFADGHIRAGTIDGTPTTDHAAYRALRDSSPANARPLLEASPFSLVLGSWDSTRKSNQVRYRSALVGEIIGVLADQGPNNTEIAARGAARFDSASPSVQLSATDMQALLDAQADELSPKNIDEIKKLIAAAKKSGVISASKLGLGSIPPSLNGLGMVACKKIIRSHVLSFSALRQIRFGAQGDGDAACRALLAALGLAALARSNSELVLRANCDLVEKAEPTLVLDARYGRVEEFGPLSIDDADDLLASAIAHAESEAGIRWEGQTLEVLGNPIVHRGSVEDDGGEND